MVAFVFSAHAAGWYAPDAGTRALGRAGAFVAGVDDLSAQYWNPAALTRTGGHRLEIDLAAVRHGVRFERAEAADASFDPVANEALPRAIPRFAYAPDLPWDSVRVAFGLYSPYAPVYRFPSDGAQRYAVVESTFTTFQLGPTVAWTRGPFSVGAGIAWSPLHIEQSLVATTALDGSDDPAFDVTTTVSALDPFALTGNAGVLLDVDNFAFGTSVQAPTKFDARGSLHTDFSENAFYTGDNELGQLLAEPTTTDDDVRVPITLPLVLRVGALIRPTAALEIEADFVWEAWSTIESLDVTELDLEIATTGGDPLVVSDDIGLPIRLRDAWSVRAGADYAVGPAAIRFGGFYESAAAEPSVRSVAIPDDQKVGYGLGASYGKGPVTVDLGWSQSFGLTPSIERSTVFQVAIDPATGDVGFGRTVGNGRLFTGHQILALGFAWHPAKETD